MSNTADQQQKPQAPVEQPATPPTLEEIRINSIIRTLSTQRDAANNQILKVTASLAVAEHQLTQFATQAEAFRNQAQVLVANNMAFADKIHTLEESLNESVAQSLELMNKCAALEEEVAALKRGTTDEVDTDTSSDLEAPSSK